MIENRYYKPIVSRWDLIFVKEDTNDCCSLQGKNEVLGFTLSLYKAALKSERSIVLDRGSDLIVQPNLRCWVNRVITRVLVFCMLRDNSRYSLFQMFLKLGGYVANFVHVTRRGLPRQK